MRAAAAGAAVMVAEATGVAVMEVAGAAADVILVMVVAGMMAVVIRMVIMAIEEEVNGITTLIITVMVAGVMVVGMVLILIMVPAGLPAAHSSSAFLSTPAQTQQLQTLTPGKLVAMI